MPTARISLAYRIESRKNDLTKDSRSVNALIESQGEGEAPRIVKRPGLSQINCTPALPTGVGQGVFTWNNQIIAACNNNIFGISGGNSVNYGSIVGSTVPLSFSKTANDTYMAFHDGSNIYVLSKNTLALTLPIGGSTVKSVTVNDGGWMYADMGQPLTFTLANPTVFTKVGNGLSVGSTFQITSTILPNSSQIITEPYGKTISPYPGLTYKVATKPTADTWTATVDYKSFGNPTITNTVRSDGITIPGTWFLVSSPTCTMTIASPCVVTFASHGLVAGQGVRFTSTGSLPTGIVANTNYCVAPTGLTTDTFQVASISTPTVSINTSGSQSGTHYIQRNPTVVFSASSGTTATGTALVVNNQVNEIVLTNAGGTGYTGVPTISSTSMPVTPGRAWGKVDSVNTATIRSNGFGYKTAPTWEWRGFLGTGTATGGGTSTIDSLGRVTSLTVTWGTSGGVYASDDIIVFSNIEVERSFVASAGMDSTISGPYARGLVYMDGYLFIMTTAGRIYQSNYEDPTNWGALNYITAESDPDKGVAIVRHQNYIVAFGSWSTDFFYNAGNPTGSILSVNKSAKLEIGCAAGGSVVGLEQAVIWVGQAQSRGRSVYMMSGTAPQKISTRYIDKYLNADTMDNVFAYVMKISGHTLYILTLKDSNITFTYDIDEKAWIQWTSQSGDVETYFKYLYFTSDIEADSSLYVQHETNGHVYEVNPDLYTDDGDSIFFRSVTNLLDSNSNKRKFITKVEIIGDKVAGTLSIRHTDDDYATWSNYRTVDLSKTRPILYQGGSTRRRAYEVFSSDNIPIRLEAMEMEFDLGEQGGGQEG